MSLYNMIHGENRMADILLAILNLSRSDVARYRDCWFDGTHIVLLTRTGGGNRDDYQGSNNALTLLPTYVRDEDDDFDCTYAKFYYNVPPAFADAVPMLVVEDKTPGERWQTFFDKMQSSPDDPQVKRVVEEMRPTMEAIAKALNQ